MGEPQKSASNTRDAPRTGWLSVLLCSGVLLLLLAAVVLLSIHFVSYAKAKTFFDGYVARHGTPGGARNVLPPEAYGQLIHRLPLAAAVLGICGLALAVWKKELACFLLEIPAQRVKFWNALRPPFHNGMETAVELGVVSVIFGTGVFLRVQYLGRPVRFDEAWTYMDFAARPLALVVSRYPAPNNHLLNTLLVHFSTHLFGNTVFALRLPAFIAGCMVILATWLVARAVYGAVAGMVAAACVAVLPTFLEFSINGRGYSLQWLCVLAVLWLAMALVEDSTLSPAWSGLVLAAAAGLYCIPTTALAVAGIFCWMLACAYLDGASGSLIELAKKLFLASVAIGLLSLLLYLPPLLVSGPAALAAQSVVKWQQGDFLPGLEHMLGCARVYWSEGVPAGILWILFGGLAVGLLLQHRIGKYKFSVTVALCLVAAIFAWSRQVFGFPRVWSYLLLSAMITAAGGIGSVLKSLAGQSQMRRVVLAGVSALGLVAAVGIAMLRQGTLLATNETGTIMDAEEIAGFLSTELRPGDALVANALVQYELLRRNPSLYGSLGSPGGASRVMAVVMKSTGNMELCTREELKARLARQEIADPALLSASIDLVKYTAPQIRGQFLTSTVYVLESKKALE